MKKLFFTAFIVLIAYHNTAYARVGTRGGYVSSTETSIIIRDVSVLDPRKDKGQSS